MGEWLFWAEAAQHELLLFCGIWFLVGAADDLAIDVLWLTRRAWFACRGTKPAQHLHQLEPPRDPGLIAIFIPMWDEGAVAAQMLARCSERWAGANYLLLVGCYPNDFATLAAVDAAGRSNPRIVGVVNARLGPTTKADCLNSLWKELLRRERIAGETAKAVALHDAEDLVHPDEIALYDTLIERFDLVQLPVRAIAVPGSPLVSGHYCDEFVEAHDKVLVVRSWLGAGLPAAGVGCAFSRSMLETIAMREGGDPFCAESLTEDYELGLKVRALGGRQTIAHIRGRDGSLICTRSCFPDNFRASARQKARWLTGIALAGWDRLGWSAHPSELWMRIRDRRAIFAAYLLLAAYVAGLLTLALLLTRLLVPNQPSIWVSDQLLVLTGITFSALLWRLLVRSIMVARVYGLRAALWCGPRLLMGNLIAIVAATKALQNYIAYCFGGVLRWDKTTHHFPPDPQDVR